MKVKDLIEKLKIYNPDLEVVLHEFGTSHDIPLASVESQSMVKTGYQVVLLGKE